MEADVLSETHQALLRLGLAPNRSLANLRVQKRVYDENKDLISVTTPIRFPEFYRQALKCFKAVAHLCMHAKKHLHVISDRQKSNEWMAVLFVDFLQRMNWSKRVNMDIVEYDSALNGGLKKDALLVFFDDMAYSGYQLKEYVESIPVEGDQGIVIAVPFLTRVAQGRMFDAIEKNNGAVSSNSDDDDYAWKENNIFNVLIYGKLVPTIREIDRLLVRKYKSNKAAVYFDHKIADNVSTYPDVYHKYIPKNVSQPFYKRRGVQISSETKFDPKFASYVNTLPPPHTKSYGDAAYDALSHILTEVYHIQLPAPGSILWTSSPNYGNLNSST